MKEFYVFMNLFSSRTILDKKLLNLQLCIVNMSIIVAKYSCFLRGQLLTQLLFEWYQKLYYLDAGVLSFLIPQYFVNE